MDLRVKEIIDKLTQTINANSKTIAGIQLRISRLETEIVDIGKKVEHIQNQLQDMSE